jgi:hypothetical protein
MAIHISMHLFWSAFHTHGWLVQEIATAEKVSADHLRSAFQASKIIITANEISHNFPRRAL